jgi:DNA polymerase III delta prime subunit
MLDARPLTLNELNELYPEPMATLRTFVHTKSFPHLILFGPEGTDKLTLARLFALEFLRGEPGNLKIAFGTDPVTKEERSEAQSTISTKRVGSAAGEHHRSNPFIESRIRPFVATRKFGDAPFKILILTDLNVLGTEQSALRRIMEQYTGNCRFILLTDQPSAIIDPILSRCQLISVPAPPPEVFDKKLARLLSARLEALPDDEVIASLREMSHSNLSRALNYAQQIYIKYSRLDPAYLRAFHETLNRDQLFCFSVFKRAQDRPQEASDTLLAYLRNVSLSLTQFYRYAAEFVRSEHGSPRLLSLLAGADASATAPVVPFFYMEKILFDFHTIYQECDSQ